jgi:nitroreductase
MTVAEHVLDSARWAPSGDNAQPWRFTLRGANAFDVHAYDTRSDCVYDLDGWASQLAHGILLETIAIAATTFRCRARIARDTADDAPRALYRVNLDTDTDVVEDPLASAITIRTVQRRPMAMQPLTPEQRATLEQAVQPFKIVWFDALPERARIAALCARNAKIRLTIPEAYSVHRAVIAWHSMTSEDRMPDASLGADRMLLATMRGAMRSWERLDRLNRWTGTLLPRLALDFLPGIRCSAQLVLVARSVPATLGDRIAAGRAVQRLWLTATTLGLQMQPQYTPLVFARYAREGRPFTRADRANEEARTIANRLDDLLVEHAGCAVWLARIGPSRPTPARSLRRPLAELLVNEPPAELPPLAAA